MTIPAAVAVVGAIVVVAVVARSGAADEFERQRRHMIALIEDTAAETARLVGRDGLDPRILEVLARVPRHRFVPDDQVDVAYENRPLPIGHGQTISQPYVVALMTELAGPGPGGRALEIGTGSGYQAAVLAELVDQVFTIEIIEPLYRQASERLAALGYDNVETRLGDGYHGWPERGPFDAILVTAAASHVPPPLVAQLAVGGRMVIPVGSRFLVQDLLLIEKAADGTLHTRQILPVAFVPLTGGH